jgi:hypothetical protein
MGKGVDLARGDAPEHAAMIDSFKEQLLVALVVKAGGKLSIPVADVDATGGWVLALAVHDGAFHFEARRKA